MPRSARSQSRSGIYHVMLRGINRQQIFYDEEDYSYLTRILSRYKSVSNYKIYAYCLMGNHIHILIRPLGESLSIIIRRIGVAFVNWYNIKYERSGHLFQDRFRSEPVDTEEYYFTVLRYILQNPVKAGLCQSPFDYPYSSIKEYAKGYSTLTDISFTFKMIDRPGLMNFLREDNQDQCLDISENIRRRVTDSSAEKMILSEFGTLHPVATEGKDPEQLRSSIRRLCKGGISVRQLCRMTGLPKALVEKALRK